MKTYIDAEELYKCETCFHNRSGGCDTYCDVGESYRPAFAKLRRITNVREVKRGKWEDKPHEYKILDFGTARGTYPTCNLCGAFQTGHEQRTKFCPGCGAEMENYRGADDD